MNYKARYFLFAYIVLVIVIGLPWLILFQFRVSGAATEIKQKEQFVVTLQKASINNRLLLFVNDVLSLAKHINSEGFCGEFCGGSESTRSAIEQGFELFSVGKHLMCNQLSYIDCNGDEIIRVDFNKGRAFLVDEHNLQNRKDRYYFKDISKLKERGVYISSLDLNIEDSNVQTHGIPIIRVGAPSFNKEGQFCGMVIINFLAENVLSAFNEQCSFSKGRNMLLNSDGYWLRNTDHPELELAFMHDSTKYISFKSINSEIWNTITSEINNQISTKEGIFTFETVPLILKDLNDEYFLGSQFRTDINISVEGKKYWKIVSFISKDDLKKITAPILRDRNVGIVVILVINILLSVVYASIKTKKQNAEKSQKSFYDDLEQKVKVRTKELEKSNKKLKDINEKVVIVNSKLEDKNVELINVNNDINNLLDSIDIGTLFLDKELNIRKFTPAVKKIFDLSNNDCGLSIEEFALKIPEGARKNIVEHSKRVLKTKESYEDEFQNYNGQFFLMRITPFITKKVNIEGAVVTFIDITPMKKAQAEALEKSNYLKVIYNTTLTGIYIYNIKNQNIEYINQRYTEILGYTKKEVGEMSAIDLAKLFHPDDHFEVSKHIQEIVKGKRGAVRTVECRFRAKDGSWKWCYTSDTGFEYKDGELVSFIGSFLDISERKKAEQTIKESEVRYKSMFRENNSVMMLIDSVNGDIVDVNRAATEYYGYSLSKMKSMNISDINILSEEKLIKERNKAQKANQGYFQFKHKLANGDIRYVKVHTGPVRVGSQELLYSIIHDNTEEIHAVMQLKKQTHELIQSEKMNVVGTFTAGIAHELNNPVMGILNYTDYCIKHVPHENKAYPVLGELKREAKRSADIVKGLLLFVRKEKDDFNDVKCDVEKALYDCLNLIGLKIKNRGVTINVPETKFEHTSKINPGHLQQVLLNILDNAVYAVKNSDIKIININFSEERTYNIITVEDSGVGISQENHKDIFTPFYTTKPVGEGTGLGLSICKNILNAVGGVINFQSKENEGTTCRIKLLKTPKTNILNETGYIGD